MRRAPRSIVPGTLRAIGVGSQHDARAERLDVAHLRVSHCNINYIFCDYFRATTARRRRHKRIDVATRQPSREEDDEQRRASPLTSVTTNEISSDECDDERDLL